jgi:hypothetical protein
MLRYDGQFAVRRRKLTESSPSMRYDCWRHYFLLDSSFIALPSSQIPKTTLFTAPCRHKMLRNLFGPKYHTTTRLQEYLCLRMMSSSSTYLRVKMVDE